jgi:hypothetical protein
LPDHPALARYAIPSPRQLDRRLPRHADSWVTDLTPAQVDRFAAMFDRIVAAMRARGRDVADLVCAVRGAFPLPLRAVLERYGLGRFRITQSANLADPLDVHRSENAAPSDWIVLGDHGSPPIWLLLGEWKKIGAIEEQAAYLARRLAPRDDQAEPLARLLVRDANMLARARFADLFASRAQHVSITFADLLGLNEPLAVPAGGGGLLRVPADYQRTYPLRATRGMALDLPRVLAMALRARGGADAGDRSALADRLMALPASPGPVA